MYLADEHCDYGPSSRDEFTECYRQVGQMLSNSTGMDSMVSVDDMQTLNLSEVAIHGLEQKIFPEVIAGRQDTIRKVLVAQDRLPGGLAPERQSKHFSGRCHKIGPGDPDYWHGCMARGVPMSP
jgi:hypothetical protein